MNNGKLIEERGNKLLLNSTSTYRSYGFRFKGEQQQNVAGIHSLGWEKEIAPSSYDWHGMTRSETGKVIFQYTLKGRGQIEIDNEIYKLTSGDAFLVDIPSKHHYYFPDDSTDWEFIFITLYGDEVEKCFNLLKNKIGQVIYLDTNSPPIEHLFTLLEKAAANSSQDAYESSADAYTFIMKLISYALNAKNPSWPESISRSILFIQQHYAEAITLDDIVEVTEMSKYHFTRLFQQCTHVTPMKFVTKIRMEQAMRLLKNETLTIEEIAREVGYANGNYFNKVFRSFIGVAPGKYRNGKTFLPFDYIVTD